MKERLRKKVVWDEHGITEILADILILAMTVVLFAIIFAFVYTLPAPNEATYADFEPNVDLYDPSGSKTTDPRAFDGVMDFLKRGSMIPLGGMGEEGADAGYKGTGMAMLIELDNVIGAGVSTSIEPLLNDKKRRIRQTFEAWRIDTLFAKNDALEHISRTISDIKTQQGKNMLLPGEKETIRRKESMKHGIPYTALQISRLEKLGQSVGLGQVS